MKSFTPDQVRAMSLAEVNAVIDGFTELKRAEAGKVDVEPTTREEFEALKKLYPDT